MVGGHHQKTQPIREYCTLSRKQYRESGEDAESIDMISDSLTDSGFFPALDSRIYQKECTHLMLMRKQQTGS